MCVSHSVVSDTLRPHALQATRLLCPRNSPGENTGVCCHSLLQRIFPTQGLNPAPALKADSLPSWATREVVVGIVQFSHSVLFDSLRPQGLQHTRPPCPSSTSGVYKNSCPFSQWCHSTISSSAVPFSSGLQSFPESRSFTMSQFFASGGQSIGVSASASVLPMNIPDWLPLRWTGCSPRDSQESSPKPQFNSINSSALSFLFSTTLTSIHHYWKNHNLD